MVFYLPMIKPMCMKNLSFLSFIFLLIINWNCTKKGPDGPGGGNNPPTEAQLADEIDQKFPFTPNQPFTAMSICGRLNSQLEWHFLFMENNTMQVLFTTDTHDDYVFDGTYTYANDQLRLMMPGGPTSPFPLGLDERSTVIMPQFGLVAGFATPEMICICEGHELNGINQPHAQANYDCPIINIQAVSDEDNAIELVHRSVPFDLAVTGSIFRQQDIYINGQNNPNIRRGYGIYRQDGNRFYASFRVAQDFADFAAGQLPVNFNPGVPFDDYNLISGTISANGQELTVDQLMPEAGPCTLR